jgi:hypothetical protein
LGVVSVPCHEDVIICLSWDPVWLQSDCKENGLEQRQTQKWRRDAIFIFSY